MAEEEKGVYDRVIRPVGLLATAFLTVFVSSVAIVDVVVDQVIESYRDEKKKKGR